MFPHDSTRPKESADRGAQGEAPKSDALEKEARIQMNWSLAVVRCNWKILEVPSCNFLFGFPKHPKRNPPLGWSSKERVSLQNGKQPFEHSALPSWKCGRSSWDTKTEPALCWVAHVFRFGTWGPLKVGVPQSFVMHTKKQGLGALLGPVTLRHPQIGTRTYHLMY